MTSSDFDGSYPAVQVDGFHKADKMEFHYRSSAMAAVCKLLSNFMLLLSSFLKHAQTFFLLEKLAK